MRILSIFVRYGTDTYPEAERRLAAVMRDRLPRVDNDVLVVDNALPAGVHERQSGRTVIGGDNHAWEFSGFDAGLRFVGAGVRAYDLVHLVTSAFNELYTDYLARFDERLLELVVGRGAALGHIDCYNEPAVLLGRPFQHWLRSCFIMLPPAELQLLGTCVSLVDPAPFFEPEARHPFRDDAPVSARYRQYLVDWLTGSDIGQGVLWHSRLGATGDAAASFQRKVMAIFNEHLLAARLRAQGCTLVDVTWLSSELARGRTPSWNTPWWTQIATRDTAAVHVDV